MTDDRLQDLCGRLLEQVRDHFVVLRAVQSMLEAKTQECERLRAQIHALLPDTRGVTTSDDGGVW